jgi:hypothetical protein
MSIESDRADFQKQIDALTKKFRDKAALVEGNMAIMTANLCSRVEGKAKRLMRETTTNPDVSYGKRKHHPSKPGYAPASDMGTMIRSITHSVEINGETVFGRVGSVLKDPPYPAYLENGTVYIAPRPWLLPAVDTIRPQVKRYYREVFADKAIQIETGGE